MNVLNLIVVQFISKDNLIYLLNRCMSFTWMMFLGKPVDETTIMVFATCFMVLRMFGETIFSTGISHETYL